MEVPEELRNRIRVDERGCWVWEGWKKKGYGYLQREGRRIQAHRYTWGIARGPVPKGLVLDHAVCQNRACCNPDHLEAVTSGENSRRALIKSHCPRGHEYTLVDKRVGTRRVYYKICRTCRGLA